MVKSWRTIKQLLNKRSKSTNMHITSDKGIEIITKKEISNAMSKYLCSVGRDLAKKLINLQILCFQVTMISIHLKVLLSSIQSGYNTSVKQLVKSNRQKVLEMITFPATF